MWFTQTKCIEIYFQRCFSKEAELPKKNKEICVQNCGIFCVLALIFIKMARAHRHTNGYDQIDLPDRNIKVYILYFVHTSMVRLIFNILMEIQTCFKKYCIHSIIIVLLLLLCWCFQIQISFLYACSWYYHSLFTKKDAKQEPLNLNSCRFTLKIHTQIRTHFYFICVRQSCS